MGYSSHSWETASLSLPGIRDVLIDRDSRWGEDDVVLAIEQDEQAEENELAEQVVQDG
jgi:hypothetical protein